MNVVDRANVAKSLLKMVDTYSPSTKCTVNHSVILPFLFEVINKNSYGSCVYDESLRIVWSSNVNGMLSDSEKFTHNLERIRVIIDECVQPIVVIKLIILRKGVTSGHSNLLIVDKNAGTFERFEPHGTYTPENNNIHQFDEINQIFYIDGNIDMDLETLASHILRLKYIPPNVYCPRIDGIVIGPQRYEETHQYIGECKANPKGFCVVWTMMYGYLRLSTPGASPRDIIFVMIILSKTVMFIPKFITFVETYLSK